jgi:predicted MFS family arabinose efflux permease
VTLGNGPLAVPATRPLLQAAGLALGPLVALGMARFAYALLLPPMRTDLRWSYTAAGTMNTANALGYLVGAAAATWLVRRLDARRVFLGGVAATAACLLACAAVGDFWALAALRVGAGTAGAIAFVAGAGLAVHVGVGLPPARATALLGVYVAGGGAGMVLSGLALPPLLAGLGPAAGWRLGWVVLGAVALAALVPAAAATRGIPAPPDPPSGVTRSRPLRPIAPTAVAYLMFGVGYVGYTTFVVALLGTELDAGQIAAFWVVLGVAAMASSFLWGPLLGRARGGRGLALMLGVIAVGAGVTVVATSWLAALASAVLFGGAFLSTVTAVTAVVRSILPPHEWSAAVGRLTVGFAVGQCVGPVLAGTLSDRGGVAAGMALSAVVLAAAALVAMAQRRAPAPEWRD